MDKKRLSILDISQVPHFYLYYLKGLLDNEFFKGFNEESREDQYMTPFKDVFDIVVKRYADLIRDAFAKTNRHFITVESCSDFTKSTISVNIKNGETFNIGFHPEARFGSEIGLIFEEYDKIWGAHVEEK